MDSTTLQKLEKMLLELDLELRAEQVQADGAEAPVTLDGTFGRLARGDALQAQQMALEMKRRRTERLQRVKSALQRIKEGTYGLCGHCSKAIGSDRLDAFPDVVLCIQCASKRKR